MSYLQLIVFSLLQDVAGYWTSCIPHLEHSGAISAFLRRSQTQKLLLTPPAESGHVVQKQTQKTLNRKTEAQLELIYE